jgi:hypothetical protein
MIHRIIIGLVLLLASTLSDAQNTVSVKGKLFQNEIRIGEQVSYELSITSDQESNIIWPIWLDTLSTNIEVVSISNIDTVILEDQVTLTQELSLTSFDSGLWVVPPVLVLVNGNSFETEAHLLSVQSIDVDTASSLKEIKPIEELPYTLQELLMIGGKIVGALILIVALIGFIFYLIKKNKNKPIQEVIENEMPLDIWVTQALDDLEQKSLWQNGNHKLYHVELSEITRTYLEKQFNILALESTTFEIEQQLPKIGFSPVIQQDLIQALRISDMAKFAKAQPLNTENEFALKAIRNVVVWVEQQKQEEHAGE